MLFKVACLQLSTQDDVAANADAIEAMIRDAAGNGAQFILLPENALLMQEQGKPFPEGVEKKALALSQSLAKELKVWLLIGSLPSPTEGERCFNRSVLINNKGETVAAYDKIHLFDAAL